MSNPIPQGPWREQPGATLSFYIDYHFLGIYTVLVILLGWLSLSVKMTVPASARREALLDEGYEDMHYVMQALREVGLGFGRIVALRYATAHPLYARFAKSW